MKHVLIVKARVRKKTFYTYTMRFGVECEIKIQRTKFYFLMMAQLYMCVHLHIFFTYIYLITGKFTWFLKQKPINVKSYVVYVKK